MSTEVPETGEIGEQSPPAQSEEPLVGYLDRRAAVAAAAGLVTVGALATIDAVVGVPDVLDQRWVYFVLGFGVGAGVWRWRDVVEWRRERER